MPRASCCRCCCRCSIQCIDGIYLHSKSVYTHSAEPAVYDMAWHGWLAYAPYIIWLIKRFSSVASSFSIFRKSNFRYSTDATPERVCFSRRILFFFCFWENLVQLMAGSLPASIPFIIHPWWSVFLFFFFCAVDRTKTQRIEELATVSSIYLLPYPHEKFEINFQCWASDWIWSLASRGVREDGLDMHGIVNSGDNGTTKATTTDDRQPKQYNNNQCTNCDISIM